MSQTAHMDDVLRMFAHESLSGSTQSSYPQKAVIEISLDLSFLQYESLLLKIQSDKVPDSRGSAHAISAAFYIPALSFVCVHGKLPGSAPDKMHDRAVYKITEVHKPPLAECIYTQLWAADNTFSMIIIQSSL